MNRIIILTERAGSYKALHEAFSDNNIEHSARGGNGMFYVDGEEYSATFSIAVPHATLRQIQELIEDKSIRGRVAVYKEAPDDGVVSVLKEIDQTVTVGPIDED